MDSGWAISAVLGVVGVFIFCLWLRPWDLYQPKSWRSFSGSTRHSRVSGKAHSFRYPVNFDWVDIDDPPRWGRILSLDWRDHAFQSPTELRKFLRAKLGDQVSLNKIYLLTKLRYAGHCFNSISFFFVADSSDGQSFHNGWLIYEVWNFPWYEHTLYLHRLQDGHITDPRQQPKTMHVSPFNPRDGLLYNSRIDLSKFNLQTHVAPQFLLIIDVMRDLHSSAPPKNENKISNDDEKKMDMDQMRAPTNITNDASEFEDKVMTTTLYISQTPTPPSLFRFWPTVIDIFLILYQAFILWKKGNPVYYHKPKLERF